MSYGIADENGASMARISPGLSNRSSPNIRGVVSMLLFTSSRRRFLKTGSGRPGLHVGVWPERLANHAISKSLGDPVKLGLWGHSIGLPFPTGVLKPIVDTFRLY